MREEFQFWRPNAKSKRLLAQVDRVLNDLRSQGYILTLRQLYYQLVAQDIIPNNPKMYNNLGNLVSKARLAGFIDWSSIEDRVRRPVICATWKNPQEILHSAVNAYAIDKLEGQENYIEVWCEKDAVSNILQPVCGRWQITFMANRGYSSQSAMYNAYNRLRRKWQSGVNIHIIYLGDFDPSGLDMVRDIETRLNIFLRQYSLRFDKRLNVYHVALTKDQIAMYNPPENPAKTTDKRYDSYVALHGNSSWELDALRPDVLKEITENAIMEFIDPNKFLTFERDEDEQKDQLRDIVNNLEI